MPKNEDFRADSVQEVAYANVTFEKGTNLHNFSPDQISNLKVSVRSARYIHIVDSLCDLWSEITDALEADFSTETDKLFKEDFEDALQKIREETLKYFLSSLNDNMAYAKRTEVI